jgi:4-hydroxy-3-methylbut-2-enyl diphosphate reductase
MLKHDWAYRQGSLAQLWQRLWCFLVKSNLYVALGAGCLSYTSSLLQNVEPLWRYFFVAFCYIYAMHILNNFTDTASKLNDPVQTRFYGRHRRFLLISGIISGLLALLIGLALTPLAFVFILIMSILGLIYTVNIFPSGLASSLKIYRLKEIPGELDRESTYIRSRFAKPSARLFPVAAPWPRYYRPPPKYRETPTRPQG